MNIVVAMKQIPDLAQIRIKDRKPVLTDVPLTFGSLDKNALEAAVQLKNSAGGTVYALAVGSEDLEDTIKEALAAGADETLLLTDDEYANLESDQTAVLIADRIKKMNDAGIILLGEGSGDNYSGQMPGRLADLLDVPVIGYAKSLELNGTTVTAVCSLEDCEETVQAQTPVVISVVSDINEIRIPAVTEILKAGKKPKEVLDADDVEIEIPAASVKTLTSLAPESNRKCISVKDVAELIEKIKAENLL
ncbi:MAG TPA: electron transfer flavoprotein subunit beta/FixA family protein [Syntrophomonas sp.]|nr:electron transfer flavoprotein subunit beta/FixA family protein [Syntrophomonas sp.]